MYQIYVISNTNELLTMVQCYASSTQEAVRKAKTFAYYADCTYQAFPIQFK